MNYYTYTGENIKHAEYQVNRIIFDGDDKEKIIEAGIPVKLSEDELNYLFNLGFVLDNSSEEESEAVQSAIVDWRESEFYSDEVKETPLYSGETVNNPLQAELFTKEVN
jgi:hypothetical protein